MNKKTNIRKAIENIPKESMKCKYCNKELEQHYGIDRFCYESDWIDMEREYAEKYEPLEDKKESSQK